MNEQLRQIHRRTFLSQTGVGLGSAALTSLLNRDLFGAGTTPQPSAAEAWPGAVNPLHFAPKAKRVIFLCMAGAPRTWRPSTTSPNWRR